MVALISLPGISLGAAQMIDGSITIPAHSKLKYVNCPCCNNKSKRVHSSYVRVLRDLSISTCCVSVYLTVRKFFCKNPECERKIFTEQPGSEIMPYSRMTNRTRETLQNILLEVSAIKGSYLANLISLPISPSTALRIVGSLPIPEIEKVTVLGIDDWAYRKGLTYGTLLVNMETGQVIDLLTGRDGVTLREWLVKHPEIEIVTRDRASAYSCTVSSILPNAIQVADRFHLLKNFSDCVYSVIRIEYRNIVNSMNAETIQSEPLPPKVLEEPLQSGPLYPEAPEEVLQSEQLPDEAHKEPVKVPLRAKGERNEYINHRFIKVKQMLEEGVGIKTIAKSLQISRNAVRRYAKVDVLPSKSIYYKYDYNEYLVIISKGFTKGKSFAKIYANMKNAGFKGSRSAFYSQFKDHPMRTTPTVYKPINIKLRLLSPRKISTYLSFTDISKIKDETDRELMEKILSKNSTLEQLRQQVISFKELLLGNDVLLLKDWIERTLAIGISQLKSFVNGLMGDIEAVRNAIKTNWSNGQVEGQVNRLKSIKRQMYGRADFDLLRRKVILSKVG
jgi:transposase